jgi:hypothetical protein
MASLRRDHQPDCTLRFQLGPGFRTASQARGPVNNVQSLVAKLGWTRQKGEEEPWPGRKGGQLQGGRQGQGVDQTEAPGPGRDPGVHVRGRGNGWSSVLGCHGQHTVID